MCDVAKDAGHDTRREHWVPELWRARAHRRDAEAAAIAARAVAAAEANPGDAALRDAAAAATEAAAVAAAGLRTANTRVGAARAVQALAQSGASAVAATPMPSAAASAIPATAAPAPLPEDSYQAADDEMARRFAVLDVLVVGSHQADMLIDVTIRHFTNALEPKPDRPLLRAEADKRERYPPIGSIRVQVAAATTLGRISAQFDAILSTLAADAAQRDCRRGVTPNHSRLQRWRARLDYLLCIGLVETADTAYKPQL